MATLQYSNLAYYKPLQKEIYCFEQLTKENENSKNLELKIWFSKKEYIVTNVFFNDIYNIFSFE